MFGFRGPMMLWTGYEGKVGIVKVRKGAVVRKEVIMSSCRFIVLSSYISHFAPSAYNSFFVSLCSSCFTHRSLLLGLALEHWVAWGYSSRWDWPY